jgi:putative FmdB family regulatory protein
VPTYQYACTACGEQLEVVQKFTDDALTVCPACQGRLRKVFSAVGVVFKGSGFYRTDSRAAANGPGDSKSESAPAASNGSSGSDNGSGAKKESGSKTGSGSTGSSSGSSESSSTGSSTATKTSAA